jgi:hypothetical protein
MFYLYWSCLWLKHSTIFTRQALMFLQACRREDPHPWPLSLQAARGTFRTGSSQAWQSVSSTYLRKVCLTIWRSNILRRPFELAFGSKRFNSQTLSPGSSSRKRRGESTGHWGYPSGNDSPPCFEISTTQSWLPARARGTASRGCRRYAGSATWRRPVGNRSAAR